jgi:hypothetical protein
VDTSSNLLIIYLSFFLFQFYYTLADSTTDKFAIYLYYFVVFLGKVCLMEGE